MERSFPFTSVKQSTLSRRPLSRSIVASMSEMDDGDENESENENENENEYEDHPSLSTVIDSQFVFFLKGIDENIKEQIVEVYSRPKSPVAVIPAELEQCSGESHTEYIKRLEGFVEKQCLEIRDLLSRNSTLAEDLSKTGGGNPKTSSGSERVLVETLCRDLHESSRVETLKREKSRIETEVLDYKNSVGKLESDLMSLSDAYNSLEQANYHLERELKGLKEGSGGDVGVDVYVEGIKAEAREEAQKESEAELSDLLVCLGQEQSRVEKLSGKLAEMGVDVDELLAGVGHDMGLPDDDDGDEEEDECVCVFKLLLKKKLPFVGCW